MSVYLTNSIDLMDGLGAQVQRRLEIYFLSRHLGVNFSLLPISNFDSNYGDGLRNQYEKAVELSRIHNFFPIETKNNNPDEMINSALVDKFISNLSWRKLTIAIRLINVFSKILRRNVLVTLPKPHKLNLRMDKLLENLDLKEQKTPNSEVEILIHLPWARNSLLPDRYVPLKWYKDLLHIITTFLEDHKIKYKIIIHTDASPNLDRQKEEIWVSPETQEYWKSSGNVPFIESLSYANLNVDLEFQDFKNLTILQNITPAQVWKTFFNKSILILSNSSLSHVGAMLHNNYIVGFIPDNKPYPLPRILPLNKSEIDSSIILSTLQKKFTFPQQ